MWGDTGQSTTLYMGNLTEPFMSEEWVRSLWYSMGENVNVKMIRDKFTGGHAGYCFVEFTNAQSAMRMLQQLNGTMMPQTNKVFKLNWASGGGVASANVHDRGPEFSVFVGDLGPEVTDVMLMQTFQARYPSCKSAKVVTDPMTGHTRGYGFVRFSDENDQARALTEMSGIYCGSRPMRVSVATPKSGTQQQPSGGSTGGRGAGGMGGMSGGGVGGMAYGAPMQPMQGGYNPFTDPNNTTVFVGGLNANVSEDELRQYFGPFGEITYTKIPPGKGCGFVQFTNRSSAEAAIAQMNGYVIGNARVRLSWGRANISDKPLPSSATPQGGWGGAGIGGWSAARPAAPYMAMPYGGAPYGGYVALSAVAPIAAQTSTSASNTGGAIGGMGGARFESSPGPSAIGSTSLVSSVHPQHMQMEDPLASVDVNQANESFISGEEAVLSNTELSGDAVGNNNGGWRSGQQQQNVY